MKQAPSRPIVNFKRYPVLYLRPNSPLLGFPDRLHLNSAMHEMCDKLSPGAPVRTP